eukprot:180224_1
MNLQYSRKVRLLFADKMQLIRHITTIKTINNFQAAKTLQLLYPDKNSEKLTKKQRRKIVDESTSIYNQIDNKKSTDVINKLLKIYLHLGYSTKIECVWNDIKLLNKTKLEYSLLIKCCLDSNNIDKCLQTLRWMESTNNYVLNIHDKLILKLIKKCSNNIKQIKFIHRLIDKG